MKALAFTVAAAVDLEEVWDYTEREWGLAALGTEVTHRICDGTGRG